VIDCGFDGKSLNEFGVRYQQDLSQSLNGSLEEGDGLSQAVLNAFSVAFLWYCCGRATGGRWVALLRFFWKG
jgi:hypothetical protein